MDNDKNILSGNQEDLQDFRKHFKSHDKRTLDAYFRIAKKKQSMMIVRRVSSSAAQMQVLVVPYKLAELKGGIRQALKSRSFPMSGFIRSIALDSKKLMVFGEHIPKFEGEFFKQPAPEKKKRKPFETRK